MKQDIGPSVVITASGFVCSCHAKPISFQGEEEDRILATCPESGIVLRYTDKVIKELNEIVWDI